jgi:hypothetical protein
MTRQLQHCSFFNKTLLFVAIRILQDLNVLFSVQQTGELIMDFSAVRLVWHVPPAAIGAASTSGNNEQPVNRSVPDGFSVCLAQLKVE